MLHVVFKEVMFVGNVGIHQWRVTGMENQFLEMCCNLGYIKECSNYFSRKNILFRAGCQFVENAMCYFCQLIHINIDLIEICESLSFVSGSLGVLCNPLWSAFDVAITPLSKS